jgi:hypothetical protein
MSSQKTNRWGHTDVLLGADNAVIRYSLRDKGQIGCRLIAIGLSHLCDCVGGVKNIPDNIIFSSEVYPFAPRSRGVLNILRNRITREQFMNTFSSTEVPHHRGEVWQSYERRMQQEIPSRFSKHERLPQHTIQVGGSQGHPDLVLADQATRTLLIVEIKKGKLSFSDGTSQLLQYYSKALDVPQFNEYSINTLLITATAGKTSDYDLWQAVMTMDRDYQMTIQEPSI